MGSIPLTYHDNRRQAAGKSRIILCFRLNTTFRLSQTRDVSPVWSKIPAPGIDHFRTPVEKGAELIRDTIRGHTSGLAQPMYVIATNIGKIPLMPDYYIMEKNEKEYVLLNHLGQKTTLPNID